VTTSNVTATAGSCGARRGGRVTNTPSGKGRQALAQHTAQAGARLREQSEGEEADEGQDDKLREQTCENIACKGVLLQLPQATRDV
jgi:hypothetical protein